MANSFPSLLGQQNLTGAVDALFMKIFSGEVQAAYQAATVMEGKQQIRTISNGKSASFAAVGKTTAEYHSRGTELLGRPIEHSEVVIAVQAPLVAHVFI